MRTSEYFSYVNRLNENLTPQAAQLGGVAIRLPLQFAPLADDPETAENELQPYYLGLDLPGVLAAYRASVEVDVDGQVEPNSAFLYVMSNEPLLSARAGGDQSVEPLEMIDQIETALQQAFGVVLPPGADGDGREPNLRYPERLPRVAEFETTKNYTAVRFQPAEDSGVFSVPMEYTLYTTTGAGDLQVALLLIAPAQPAPNDTLRPRVTMMLETLRLSGADAGGERPGNF